MCSSGIENDQDSINKINKIKYCQICGKPVTLV